MIVLKSRPFNKGEERMVDDLAKEAGWESLYDRRRKHRLISYFKMVNGLSPYSLSSLVPQSVGSISTYNLRSSQIYRIPPGRTELYKKVFTSRSY